MISEPAIYRGTVWHSRVAPVRHDFRYPLWLAWLDLDQIEQTLSRSPLWGRRFRPVTFRDQDFVDSSDQALTLKVRQRAAEYGMNWSRGRVLMLAQLRTFGWLFNPLVLYWHFPEGEEQPDGVLAEVRNTPWQQRHWYPLPLDKASAESGDGLTVRHPKAFHVSPFMHMAMDYHWHLELQGEALHVRIDNHDQTGKVFTAGLRMQRLAINSRSMRHIIREFGWQTLHTSLRIYRQAWSIWRLGVPFVPHPDRKRKDDVSAGGSAGPGRGRRR